MSGYPLAYHITFGTHGARLHGDARGTVDRRHNQYGEPLIARDNAREGAERASLRLPSLYLSQQQQVFAEAITPEICDEFGWTYHINACQSDHAHTLLLTERDGKVVRRLLKRRLSQVLSEKWPLGDGKVWWASGGSIKKIWNDKYFQEAYDYIRRQRATERFKNA